MKLRFNPLFVVGTFSLVTTSFTWSAEIIKANNTTALNLGTSWTGGIVPGPSDIGTWNNTVTAANTVVLGADLSWQGLRITNPGGAVTLSAGNTLTLGSEGLDMSAATNNLISAAPINFSANQSWRIAAGRAATINAIVNANNFPFTKEGDGTAVWAGTETQNLSTIVIKGGALRAADGSTLPSNATLSLEGGALETTTEFFTRSLGTGPGQVSFADGLAGGFSARSRTVNINFGNTGETLTWGVTPFFNPSALILNASAADNALTFSHPIDLNGVNRTIDVRANTAIIPTVISGGAAGLTKINGGTLLLNGQNTFTGPVSVTGGALRAGDGVGLPTDSPFSLTNGVFESSGDFIRSLGSAAGQVKLAGTSGFSASGAPLNVNIGGNGQTISLTDANFNIGTNTLVLNNYSATAALDFKNGIDLGTTNRGLDVRANTATISGVISGTAGFTLNGSNGSSTTSTVLVLSNQNTYTGATVVANTSAGGAGGRTRIAITTDRNLGPAPASPAADRFVMAVGGVLQANESFTLSPNRGIGIGGTGGGAVLGNISAQANKYLTIPGIIADRTTTTPSIGSLAKLDTGMVFLNQPANTYSGGTTINGGFLAAIKLANGGVASSIGDSSNAAANLILNSGRLQYLGEGDSTDRLFSLNSATTGGLDSSGAGPVHFTNTGANVANGTGGRLLTLSGYNQGENLIDGGFSNTVNALPTPTTGTWTTGNTTITVASTTGLVVGQTIAGPGIPANSTINSINTAALTLVISRAPTADAVGAPITVTNPFGVNKFGSGNWVLRGANTYNGVTRVNGGGSLIIDHALADATGTGNYISQGGTLAFRGKPSGQVIDSIPSLQLGESHFSYSVIKLLNHPGNPSAGVNLTIGSLDGVNTAQRHDLIDYSSGSGNSIIANSLGNTLTADEFGILLNNSSASTTGRASIILKDQDGSYGFASRDSGTGRIQKFVTNLEGLPTSNLTGLDTNTAHYIFRAAGTYNVTGQTVFSTLSFESYSGPIIFNLGTTTINPTGVGRALLFSGRENITINGPATGISSSSWFHNYLEDPDLPNGPGLALNFGFGTGSIVPIIDGAGFTIYSGIGFGNNFMSNGSNVRITTDQDISAQTGQFRFTSGAVLELGADLNGTAANDLTNAVGNANGNFRFFGDSGLSAFTAAAGGTRTVNFGQDAITGVGQDLVWGTAGFLTTSDASTDGDFTLKLSTGRSNALVELKNNISLNNRNRVINVANGSNAVDARLSGVISGIGVGFTKTGSGVLELSGANTYTGTTRVASGILRVGSSSLSSSSRLRIDSGAFVEVSGNVTVQSLVLNGVAQPSGTYTGGSIIGGNVIVNANGPTLTPYDQWVLDKAIPAGVSGPNQDADNDGLVNLLEYAVGSEPLTPGGSVLTKGAGNTVVFNRALGRTDLTSSVIEVSTTLTGTWTEIAKSTAGSAFTSSLAGVTVADTGTAATSPVTITDNNTPTATKKFYRLRVTKP